MERGDVLTLNQHIHDPLEVHVGSRKKFTAQPGKKRNHMAVQILEKTEEGEEQHE
jgi:flagellar motor switch protein FliM